MATVGMVLALLVLIAGAKELLGFPKALAVTLMASLLVWSGVFWSLPGKRAMSVRSVLCWVLPWSLGTAAMLGGIYQVDRAGWTWFSLTGYDVAIPESFPDQRTLPAEEFARQNRFAVLEGDRLVVPTGTYRIPETVIIPEGTSLAIEPGTVLRFGAGCSLISYSPVVARGTAERPIVFTAEHRWLKWGVIGLVKADGSRFDHVQMEHARWAVVDGIGFLGGLSLIETDAAIRESRFSEMFGKDALYVRGGHVAVAGSTFRDVFRDGIDFDAGTGRVSNNLFDGCGDEAVDLSEHCRVHLAGNAVRNP